MVNYFNALRKSAQGTGEVTVPSMELESREIWLAGDIDSENINVFIRKLLNVCKTGGSKEPIKIFITTDGGSIDAGLAAYDAMVSCPAPIYTYAIEKAYSMGVILLQGGEKRFILPNTKVMLHRPLLRSFPGGNIEDFDSVTKSLKKTETQLVKLLCKATQKQEKEIRKAISYDHYFTAEEAVDFNLVDEIVGLNDIL